MTGRLQGKIALVTAAGQGIGRAIAERFAAEGARVLATDRDSTLLHTVQGCDIHELDVTHKAAIEGLLGRLPGLDILVNCAGFVHSGTILECDESDWDTTFDINVKSMYSMIRESLPIIVQGGGGSIVNMASVASSVKGVANRFAYGASKAAVIGLTKAVAADFVGLNVRCNAICPGTVDSPSLRQRLEDTGNYEWAMSEFTARQPMGRLGSPGEVADLALYLASDESSFTTGQACVIDGGWSN